MLTYDPADPQGPSAAMRQAVDGGADYIAVSGQSIDILGQALDAAKAKNIPVIDMYSTDDVGGAANGIYANVGGTPYSQRSGALLSDFVIADSGGDANVLFVNVPDFKILQIVADAVDRQLHQPVPELHGHAAQRLDRRHDGRHRGVAGRVGAAVEQQDRLRVRDHRRPGDRAPGSARCRRPRPDKVKIVGGVPNTEQVQSLIDGKAAAYTPLGRPASAWAAMDVMARLSLGMDPDAKDHELLPAVIWTPTTCRSRPRTTRARRTTRRSSRRCGEYELIDMGPGRQHPDPDSREEWPWTSNAPCETWWTASRSWTRCTATRRASTTRTTPRCDRSWSTTPSGSTATPRPSRAPTRS